MIVFELVDGCFRQQVMKFGNFFGLFMLVLIVRLCVDWLYWFFLLMVWKQLVFRKVVKLWLVFLWVFRWKLVKLRLVGSLLFLMLFLLQLNVVLLQVSFCVLLLIMLNMCIGEWKYRFRWKNLVWNLFGWLVYSVWFWWQLIDWYWFQFSFFRWFGSICLWFLQGVCVSVCVWFFRVVKLNGCGWLRWCRFIWLFWLVVYVGRDGRLNVVRVREVLWMKLCCCMQVCQVQGGRLVIIGR